MLYIVYEYTAVYEATYTYVHMCTQYRSRLYPELSDYDHMMKDEYLFLNTTQNISILFTFIFTRIASL